MRAIVDLFQSPDVGDEVFSINSGGPLGPIEEKYEWGEVLVRVRRGHPYEGETRVFLTNRLEHRTYGARSYWCVFDTDSIV